MGRLSGCQGPGRLMRQRWELCPGLAWCSSSNCWEPASPEDKLVTEDLAERPVPLGVGFFRCNRNNLTPSTKAGPASPGHRHHRSWPWETDPAWTTREYGTVTSSAAGLASAGDFRQATAKSGLRVGVRTWLPPPVYPARASCSLFLCHWPPRE